MLVAATQARSVGVEKILVSLSEKLGYPMVILQTTGHVADRPVKGTLFSSFPHMR